MESLDLLDHMDQGVLKDHLEIWVFLDNKGHMVGKDPEVKKVNLEMDLKTPCSEMPVPEVSFLKLPKVQDYQDPQDHLEFLAKMGPKVKLEMYLCTTQKIMRIWSRVHLDLKVLLARQDLMVSVDVVENEENLAKLL